LGLNENHLDAPLFGMPDEPVFFFISVFIAPLGFAVGIIVSLIIFLKGLFSRLS